MLSDYIMIVYEWGHQSVIHKRGSEEALEKTAWPNGTTFSEKRFLVC